MRLIIFAAALSATPAFAVEPPSCALAAPAAATAAAEQVKTAPPIAQAVPAPVALPPALSAIPVLQHIAAAGATVTDLGVAHGVHAVAARSGDEFRLFQVTSDGQAAVSGALTDMTPAQMTLLASGHITELPAAHGLSGLFVRSGPQFQVMYVTPDSQRLIPGVMWAADGTDITRQQVAGIPGAIPTVVVASGNAAAEATSATHAPAAAALPLMQRANFGTVGPSSAPHLFMLVDPQCIYSVRAYQMLHAYVASGKLQLSIVPLSVLDYEDHGQSTKSALALLSKTAEDLVPAWQSGDVGGAVSPDAASRLAANMAIAHAIDLHGTPTLLWRKTDGSEGRLDGLPSNVEALLASIGS